jgi:exopolyphosphatase/guanosine-5'-triphosphate,3'-diphosphate pyrophosphatase
MSEKQTLIAPDVIPRLAAIDVGSNSVRLVVAEAQSGGRYRVLDEERESTRLGRALAKDGVLDVESVEQTLAALRRFKSIAAGLGAENLRAIATCAVREAKNGGEFAQRVREEIGVPLEVIDSDQEAQLAFSSVRRRFDLTGKNTLLADIGGGSTEIVLATGEIIESVYATRLGAVRIGEKFGAGVPIDDDGIRRMMRWIDRELRSSTEKPTMPIHQLIGSGGTFTNLASIVMASRGLSGLSPGGCQVTRADVRHLVDRLRKMSLAKRREVPGLNPDRVDIIVPGLAVIDAIMRRFRVNLLQVHNFGVRDGLLFSMLDDLQGEPRQASSPLVEEQIDRFCETCGVSLSHARHVARLACRIYECLAPSFGLPEDDLRLLDAAARMQDVGYLISYDGHHKHSYHLILHSQIESFLPEELQIVANVARYHRGASPKKKHENFRSVSLVDRERIRRMAAILRVAGGLDRSHNQTVLDAEATCRGDSVEIVVHAEELPEVDLWAARRRAGLFEEVFDVKLALRWA